MHVKTDKPPSPWMKRTNGRRQVHLPGPGHPAPEDVNNSSSPAIEVLQGPDIRPQPRTSGSSRSPGNPAPRPDIRRRATETTVAEPSSPDIRRPARKSGQKPGHPAPRYRTSRSFALQPGHPAPPEAPDIRPPLSAHSKGRGPCTPSTP